MIKVGDIVKSHDFNGIDDCYMVGKVVGVHFDGTFRAKFISKIWRGAEDRKFNNFDFFTAPQQGQHMFDSDEFARIQVIG
jgi:hypothetical protein